VLEWRGDDVFTFSDVEYVCRPVKGRFPSTSERFCLLKARWQVEWYEQLLHEVAPQAMIEVGIYDGASVALCAELARPRKLVGIDRRAIPSAALNEFIARRGLEPSVRPYYGVDQADTERLDAILLAEFDGPLDLVVDDASHLLEPTQTTFNCLFPRLRPGGRYVIEDWPTHQLSEPGTPLTVFVFELVLVCAANPGSVASVTLNRNYVVVTRGEAELEPEAFELSKYYGPRAKTLIDKLRVNADASSGAAAAGTA
jgi:Methyltransferase domain